MDDGAFWHQTPQGLVAARIAPGGPAARAGVRQGDVLVAVNGEEALTPARLERLLGARRPGDRASYTLLRESDVVSLHLVLAPSTTAIGLGCERAMRASESLTNSSDDTLRARNAAAAFRVSSKSETSSAFKVPQQTEVRPWRLPSSPLITPSSTFATKWIRRSKSTAALAFR
jgi:membrane-associated protease RseP (regulator of RpoE activity)